MMGKETAKAFKRRMALGYFDKYLVGHGIDIGAGDDLLSNQYIMKPRSVGISTMVAERMTVDGWDKANGDAQHLHIVKDNVYDFVYSSHCLEHLDNPHVALRNWIRVLKPSGYLFIVVPDEQLYEQGKWPSRGNGEHKTTWHIVHSHTDWGGHSRILPEMINEFTSMQIKSIQLIDNGYDYELAKRTWVDQSGEGAAEVGIELIAQKYPWTSFARP